jgi:protein-S-isoprenylcysteine O-methyltransferase Ste14
MDTGINFRIISFVLLVGMLSVRMIFNMRLRQQGERIMPDRGAIRREGVGLFAIRFVMFFVLMIILVLYAIHHPWIVALDFNLAAWLRWVGFAIGLLSIILTFWTEIALGRQFSPQLQLRQQHQLITSGPYAYVRHPLYTALDAFGFSLALVSANWYFVAIFMLSLVGLAFRVPKEERMMQEQFGEAYSAYSQKTGRFLPKLF